MPSLTPIRAYWGSPGTSAAPTNAYQVPTGEKLIIKHIRISNTTASAATITIITGATTSGTPIPYFVNALSIKPNDVVIFDINEVLEAGEKIVLQQGTANALQVQISGIEVIV
jgi:hypothetical protein